MNSRWFNIAVFALWLSTMTWLVTVKILPSLIAGDPPDPVAMLAAQAEDQLVGYEVRWDQTPIGWALIRGERMAGGTTKIDGQIVFDRLPIRRMVPGVFLRLLGWDGTLPEHVPLHAKNLVFFHGNGRLQRFESTVSLGLAASTIMVEGFVVEETMVLSIRSGGMKYKTRRSLPRQAVVSDGLMPQSRMPGLRDGQKWTLEAYSPLRPHTDPMEILQAEVVGRAPITWAGRLENAWLVVYRNVPGSEAGRDGKEHARLWVREDGVVLRHRIAMLDGELTFVRMPDGSGDELQQVLRERTRAVSSSDVADGSPVSAQPADRETTVETEQP